MEAAGTLLVAGDFTSFNGAGRNRIARLNADGSVETAFTPSVNNNIDSLKLESTGTILIGGTFTSITGVGGVATTRNRLARLLANGALDTTFNPNVGGSVVHDITVQLDSSIVFTGDFTSVGGQTRDGIGRVFGSGAVDMAYTARYNDTNPDGFAVAVQPDGAALYGGSFQFTGLTTTTTKLCGSLLRVNADGSIDANFFAAAGITGDAVVREIFVRANGKILVGGNFTAVGRFPVRDIGQLNADGTLDETFNVNGFGGNGQNVTAFAEQPDGKILVGGDDFTSFNLTARNSVARLNADGTIDASFTSGLASNNDVLDIEVLADGRIVLVGNFSTYAGQPRSRIVVVNPNGSLDMTIFINSGTGANGVINAVEVDADGKFLIGGTFTSYNGTTRNHIARVNADGSLDTTFDPGSGFPPINGQEVEALELQPDGAIVVAGGLTSYNSTPRNRIARVNPDGSLDTSFVPPTGVFGNRINQIALQADGKTLVVGNFGTPAIRIARLNVDGSHDTSFNPPTGANNQVYAVAVQADRKILIGGTFTSVNGAIRWGTARLEPGEPIVWNGSSSTDWNTAANWTPAGVPTIQDAVIIPAVAPNNPVIAGTFSVNTLTVEAGKTATINGSFTTISLFNSGTINGAGTLILGGLVNLNNGMVSVADPRINGGLRIVSGAGAFASTFMINGGTLRLGSDHQFSAITRTTGLLDLRTFTLRLNGAGSAFNFGGSLNCFGPCHLEFNGTSPQTTAGNGASGFLTINNPAGVTLTTNNLTISENLTLTSGIFNTGTFTVTLNSNATVTRTNGYIVGDLRKQFLAGAADFTFHVGTPNGYSPVTLAGILGAGDFTVRANQGSYPFTATGMSIYRAARWWRLTNNGLTEADLTFTYLPGDTTGTEASYRAYRIPTGGGAATMVASTINTVAKTVTAPDVQTFSDWTLADAVTTAAEVSVGGRITVDGRGVARAFVTLTDESGATRMALTNAFGYYRFTGVESGRSYVASVRHKRYQFAPRLISVSEELTDVDFSIHSQGESR